MTKDNAIVVRGLRKQYRDATAVDGLDLTVGYGEVVALLGPNGVGKTTTVEVLEGHRPRSGGEVSVLGVDPAHPTLAWRRQIGIVLQEAGDVAELTVGETVGHFARYYPDGRDAAEVIDMVGLTAQARRRVRLLSGGQRRRLDVAIGVVGRPRLLFLDEPTTGFDPQARRQFWDINGLACQPALTYLSPSTDVRRFPPVFGGGRNPRRLTRPAAILGRRKYVDVVPVTEAGVDSSGHRAAATPRRFGCSNPNGPDAAYSPASSQH